MRAVGSEYQPQKSIDIGYSCTSLVGSYIRVPNERNVIEDIMVFSRATEGDREGETSENESHCYVYKTMKGEDSLEVVSEKIERFNEYLNLPAIFSSSFDSKVLVLADGKGRITKFEFI